MTDAGELGEFLHGMSEEQNELTRATLRIMWHMRGSLSREEAWAISHSEREEIIKLIEEHKELTSKTGMPLL